MQPKPPPDLHVAMLRRIARATGLSQRDIATELGVSLRTVQRKMRDPDKQFMLALLALAHQVAPNWRTAAE